MAFHTGSVKKNFRPAKSRVPRPAAKKLAQAKKSTKNQLRDLMRLLSKANLPPPARAKKEKELAELEAKIEKHKKSELEKKYAIKYHKVKFFERQKIQRRIRKLENTAKSGDLSPEQNDELAQLRNDLLYVQHFPKGEKYVSLLKLPEDAEAAQRLLAERERLRALVRQQLQEQALLTEADEGKALQARLGATVADHRSAPARQPQAGAAVDVPDEGSDGSDFFLEEDSSADEGTGGLTGPPKRTAARQTPAASKSHGLELAGTATAAAAGGSRDALGGGAVGRRAPLVAAAAVNRKLLSDDLDDEGAEEEDDAEEGASDSDAEDDGGEDGSGQELESDSEDSGMGDGEEELYRGLLGSSDAREEDLASEEGEEQEQGEGEELQTGSMRQVEKQSTPLVKSSSRGDVASLSNLAGQVGKQSTPLAKSISRGDIGLPTNIAGQHRHSTAPSGPTSAAKDIKQKAAVLSTQAAAKDTKQARVLNGPKPAEPAKPGKQVQLPHPKKPAHSPVAPKLTQLTNAASHGQKGGPAKATLSSAGTVAKPAAGGAPVQAAPSKPAAGAPVQAAHSKAAAGAHVHAAPSKVAAPPSSMPAPSKAAPGGAPVQAAPSKGAAGGAPVKAAPSKAAAPPSSMAAPSKAAAGGAPVKAAPAKGPAPPSSMAAAIRAVVDQLAQEGGVTIPAQSKDEAAPTQATTKKVLASAVGREGVRGIPPAKREAPHGSAKRAEASADPSAQPVVGSGFARDEAGAKGGRHEAREGKRQKYTGVTKQEHGQSVAAGQQQDDFFVSGEGEDSQVHQPSKKHKPAHGQRQAHHSMTKTPVVLPSHTKQPWGAQGHDRPAAADSSFAKHGGPGSWHPSGGKSMPFAKGFGGERQGKVGDQGPGVKLPSKGTATAGDGPPSDSAAEVKRRTRAEGGRKRRK